MGVDGMVTQKNPDENVNHLPSATSCKNGGHVGDNTDKRLIFLNVLKLKYLIK